MLDAIKRARAERRLAARLAVVLLILVAALHALCGIPHGSAPTPSTPSAITETTP